MSTIYDIAKKAGISATTVSKVFNNYKDVSDKTREKVLRIAEELSYIPNLNARSLKTNRSFLIGVVFSENGGIGLEHQFFSVVLESFRKSIGQYGYDTIFINKDLGHQKMSYLDHCKYRNVDGIFIITASPDDLDFEKLINSELKCVTTDVMFENTPYVMSDNQSGSHLAVNYLYNQGHRRIAHLSGPLETISAQERFNGYCEVMEEIGLGFNEDYLAVSKMYNFDDAYEATIKFFTRFDEKTRPTAIYVGADIMAIAVIQALNTLHLKVPEDISVIGFDDISLASYSNPALTTIKQDKEAIGHEIAIKLYNMINGQSENKLSNRIPVSLIERDSVIKINAE